MKDFLHTRAFKTLYKIYGYIFWAVAIYTIGFIIFVMFDTNENAFWLSYWDVMKVVLIVMVVPLLILFCGYYYRHSRMFRH
jgi:hypothetical protein